MNLKKKKNIIRKSKPGWCVTLCFYTLTLFFISACGLVDGQNNSFLSNSKVGDAGDGKTPDLGPLLRESSALAEKECKDNSRCEEACKKIYEDTDSYKECYELNIGEVSKIEDVFHVLVESELEDLEDIDEEDLERYVKVGLDGWRDKVIEKQKEDEEDRNDKFQNTFFWMVDQERDVIPVLETEDQDNEILEEIFLSHCDEIDSESSTSEYIKCKNEVNPFCKHGQPCASSELSLNYSSGDIYAPGGTVKIAHIKEEKNKDLFVALVNSGDDFFKRAAENRRFDAFILGNKLVEQACSNRDDTSFNQCVAALYCHLRDNDHLNQDHFRREDIEEGVGREIDLKNCHINYDEFDAI